VALLADTIHNFSDALTSIPLWIAFVVGRRLATRSYTYGYRRAEDLSGLFIVAMIALSAVLAGWESIRRLISPQEVENLGLVVLAGVIGFLGNEAVALYRIRVGGEIGSAALVADGHHARADGLTSLAVVLGAGGVALGFPAADPIIGLLITVAILFVLRDASRQVFRRLMDAIEPETLELVETTATGVDGVRSVGQVRVRWLGHRLDASLHVLVDQAISVAEGHTVAETVRHELFHALPSLDEVTIHVDPDGGDHHHEITRHHASRSEDDPGPAPG
ncbi:MAG: cation diffusion facilitator family transporter, partial [Acidimicrobiia bacterium]